MPERPEAGKVTLEELLRVKRAERPSPEFWARFDHDLRAKQLAAIVEPRPWWITFRLPHVARAFVRYQLPAGAVAVLALSFIVIREYRSDFTPKTVIADEQIIAGKVIAPVLSAPRTMEVAQSDAHFVAAFASPEVSVAPVDKNVTIEQSARAAIIKDSPVGPGELLAMIPWAAPQQSSVKTETITPAVIGELPKIHFASAIKPARDHRFEDSSFEVVPVVSSAASSVEFPDEFADMLQTSSVSPREVRRNRILTNLVVADNTDTDGSRMSQVREILTSSLDNGQLYDSVRRVGMGGDRLTLKF